MTGVAGAQGGLRGGGLAADCAVGDALLLAALADGVVLKPVCRALEGETTGPALAAHATPLQERARRREDKEGREGRESLSFDSFTV